ncbi:MAG: hypothetical protein Q8N65_00460, partial [bacterium]|nr:hypothetical protein [bacterium]
GRGGGRGPRLCLGIRFRRTQPRIYIAGECPGLCPGVHFRREGSSLDQLKSGSYFIIIDVFDRLTSGKDVYSGAIRL